MKVSLFLAGLLAVALAEIQMSPNQEHEARLALENPDLFDGDIAGIDVDSERSSVVGDQNKWPNARVPYVIDDSLKDAQNLIEKAMHDFHINTCVRFVPRSDESSYIKIYAGEGCHSLVGKGDGEQTLSLGPGCLYVGTIAHQLEHALGFYHEHNRSDRDEYLIMHLDNVYDNMRFKLRKFYPENNILYNAFDYNSIMMYSNKAFSKNGEDTMVARNGQRLIDPYKKPGLSRSDIERINKMYNCK